jgi:DNA-binding response OmpR family regulator
VQVLVVDDEPQVQGMLADFLATEGYAVTTASDGREALAQIEAEQPGLLLLDMRMPGMNGWELARELKSRGLALPIIVITSAQDARRCASEIAARDYVPKPLNLRLLLQKIDGIRGDDEAPAPPRPLPS